MKWLARFGRFWYEFIVGDDWTIAIAAVGAVAIAYAVAHAGHTAWPIVPLGVVATLSASLFRARS